MKHTKKEDETKNYALHSDAIVAMIIITGVLLVIISFDTFQEQSHTPPWITYCLAWTLIPIVGWIMYFWPSHANWHGYAPYKLLSKYKIDNLAWLITHLLIWIYYGIVSISVFYLIGWDAWPSMSDPFTNHESNLFYILVLLMFFATAFTLTILWFPLWSEVLKCYTNMNEFYEKQSLGVKFKSESFKHV